MRDNREEHEPLNRSLTIFKFMLTATHNLLNANHRIHVDFASFSLFSAVLPSLIHAASTGQRPPTLEPLSVEESFQNTDEQRSEELNEGRVFSLFCVLHTNEDNLAGNLDFWTACLHYDGFHE